jgi:hypothetical protein
LNAGCEEHDQQPDGAFQVKQQHGAEIDRRKNRLDERLSRDSWPEKGGPVLAGGNERMEVVQRVQATAFGGIGLVHRIVRQIGLPGLIDDALQVFKVHCPYRESDHVLNIAYNVVCGGRTLDDIELRRQDEAYMNALGAVRIPDPTTAGDFLRRLGRGGDRRPVGGDQHCAHPGLEEKQALLLRARDHRCGWDDRRHPW